MSSDRIIQGLKAEMDVLVASIFVLSSGLDAFISECLDENGKPKEPNKKALMEARKLLPASYRNTLVKK